MPFKALHLHPQLVQAIRTIGYADPTPIQQEAIPPAIAGRDLIATAQTGTGKTAAFLLPILHRLLPLPRGAMRALVVTPTRELATQIVQVGSELCQHTTLRPCLIVGGAAMGPQEKLVRRGVELVVATPGRLLDHMATSQAPFNSVQILVLDEADRMLDMGFLPDLKRIIARLPGRKQTLLFSATMPPVIGKLASEILHKPQTIQIGRRSTPAVGITQAAYPVSEHLKSALLRHLLRNTEMPSVLIFTRTKQSARRLARTIKADGFTVTELHANLTQGQRTRAMDGFRREAYQVMVATNIAARGLDVNHITHVISYDVPHVPDDYIHRIGRTGRAEAEGDAFVLVSPTEEKSLAQIERQIGKRLPRITLPDFDYAVRNGERIDRGAPAGSSRRPKPKHRQEHGSYSQHNKRRGRRGRS